MKTYGANGEARQTVKTCGANGEARHRQTHRQTERLGRQTTKTDYKDRLQRQIGKADGEDRHDAEPKVYVGCQMFHHSHFRSEHNEQRFSDEVCVHSKVLTIGTTHTLERISEVLRITDDTRSTGQCAMADRDSLCQHLGW